MNHRKNFTAISSNPPILLGSYERNIFKGTVDFPFARSIPLPVQLYWREVSRSTVDESYPIYECYFDKNDLAIPLFTDEYVTAHGTFVIRKNRRINLPYSWKIRDEKTIIINGGRGRFTIASPAADRRKQAENEDLFESILQL